MKTVKTLVAATVISLLAVTTGAHAGGFLADTFIAPFCQDCARAADQINHNLGNPVDHTIAAGMDAVVPGTGTALEAGWAIQRSGMLNGFPQNGGFVPQMQPQVMRAPQQTVGNFCWTPVGRFGPGPVNSVGAGCSINGPFGPVFGTVGM